MGIKKIPTASFFLWLAAKNLHGNRLRCDRQLVWGRLKNICNMGLKSLCVYPNFFVLETGLTDKLSSQESLATI